MSDSNPIASRGRVRYERGHSACEERSMFTRVAATIHSTVCRVSLLLALLWPAFSVHPADEPGLLFYVSGEKGTTADFSAGGTPEPNFDFEVTRIPDGAKGAALRCGDLQRRARWAPRSE